MGDRRLLRELGRVQSGRGFESAAFWIGLALTGLLTLSGAYLFFVEDLTHLDMSLLLAHILGGFPFVVPVVMLAKRHVRYASIMRSTPFGVLGWVTVAFMAFALGTGVWLTFYGVTGQYPLWLGHVVISLASAVGLAVYIGWVLRAFKIHLPATERAMRFFWRTTRSLGGKVAVLLSFLICVCGAVAWAYVEPPVDIEVPDYVYTGDESPFFPSRATTMNDGFYNPELFLDSDGCGNAGCHEATTRQWKDSVHYRTPTPVFAAVQSLFMEEARKGEFLMDRKLLQVETERDVHGGEESFRFCAGCHTPVALMAGEIGIGTELPSFEEREAASCIFCHRIQATGEIGGGGGGDYRVSPPPNRYLFAFSDNDFAEWMNNTLINAKPQHHKNMFMKPSYTESEYCVGCHKRLQYSYWKDSVFADEDHPEHAECQDCHFPETEVDDDVSAYEDGVVANHRSFGANLVTPTIYGLDEQITQTLEFMRDDNQELNVVIPTAAAAGEDLTIAVRVINKGAGHIFPAGPESDLLEAWTEVVVFDANGDEVWAYGLLDERGYLDHDETYVYNVRPFDKDGNMLELDRHRSWVFAEDRMHVIPVKTYDEHPFAIPIPADVEGPLEVRVRLRFRKFNQEFLDFAAAAGFMERIEAPVVDVHTRTRTVALTSDAVELEAARAAVLHEVQNPTDLDEYAKKPRFDDYLIHYKLPLEDKMLMADASQLYAYEDYEEALALMGGISDRTMERAEFQRLRTELERAVSEQATVGSEEIAPFDGY
ncbi:MAG: hypothetical protein GY913_05870 [Proteobacteria bacterium]|nr:hypothetical protein [Pseudomonadota bacterium]MCP4916432.1 hypothetical protein [Pseudomonadota bacterium]